MEKEKIFVNMLGTFSLTRGEVTVDITKVMGKQLINLFQVLIFQRDVIVSKGDIIDILYSDSENPDSIVKFSIFRLRKELKKLGIFNDEEDVIITQKSGYQLNRYFEWIVDVDEYCICWEAIKYAEELNDDLLDYARRMMALYRGRIYVTSNCSVWIEQVVEFFRSTYVSCVSAMCKYYMQKKDYRTMMNTAHHAIILEPFYEGLHYYYIKGLIELNDYHEALKYYDELNARFYRELGTGLSAKFRELYEVISDELNDETIIDKSNVNEELLVSNGDMQGFYCDYDMFKHMYEVLLKGAKRDKREFYLIVFDLDTKVSEEIVVKVMNQLKEIVGSSLRANDIFARVNHKQLIVLVSCQAKDNVYIIIQRINKKFYNKYNSSIYRLNYDVTKAEYKGS